MSATATEAKAAPAKAGGKDDLAALLGVETVPLADLRAAGVDDVALARAWAKGDIEFGHRQYCVTGPVGKMGSALVVEDGWDWSGPKTKMHKNFRDLAAEAPPKTEKCKIYKPVPPERFGDEPTVKPVEIPHEEAHALVAVHVRLTDKGLGASG